MNVLVVDDTKNIRQMLTTCLEMEGYTVKTAGEGKTALQILSKERFGLVFLDIKLPLFSGTEVLREMRETGINIPVIIVTAYATVKNAVECTNLGAVAYLQKPFTAEKVRSVLSEVLNFSADKSSAQNRISLAKSRIEAGLFKEAERILKNAVGEYPLEPLLYQLLSQVSRELKNEADALKYEKIFEALQ
jgi:two-component system OmpR family response regulator